MRGWAGAGALAGGGGGGVGFVSVDFAGGGAGHQGGGLAVDDHPERLDTYSGLGERRVNAAPIRSTAAGLALLTVAGCGQMDTALSQRWMDVSFKPGTSVAQVPRIRAASDSGG